METPIKDRFFLYIEDKGKRDNTIKSYTNSLNQLYNRFSNLLNTEDEYKILKSINNDMMEDYIRDLRKVYKLTTINNKIGCWVSFFKYVCDQKNILDFNPLGGDPFFDTRGEVEKKDILTYDELQELIESTYIKGRQERMFEFNSARDRFILALEYTTGSRISEILNSRCGWLESYNEGYMLNIPEDIVKNHFNKRLPIQKKVLEFYREYEELKKYYNIDSEYLVVSASGKQYDRINWNKELKKIMTKANIEKHITSHRARDYFVTESKLRGYDIEIINRIGGWQTQDVKFKYYTNDRSFDDEKIKVCNSLI